MADPERNERNIKVIHDAVVDIAGSMAALTESVLSYQTEMREQVQEQSQQIENLINDAIADRKAMQAIQEQLGDD